MNSWPPRRSMPAAVQPASGIRQFVPLTWIALGTFATGTESFMIAALLPGLASDLSVSLIAAGQLVTVFAPYLRGQFAGPLGADRRRRPPQSASRFDDRLCAGQFLRQHRDRFLATPCRANPARRCRRPLRAERKCARRRDGGAGTPRHRSGYRQWRNQHCGRAWRAAWRDGWSHAWLAYDLCRSRHHGLDRCRRTFLRHSARYRQGLVGAKHSRTACRHPADPAADWFPRHHAMGGRRLCGLHLFDALPNHGHPHRRRARRNSLLRLGRIGCHRLVFGRHAERSDLDRARS